MIIILIFKIPLKSNWLSTLLNKSFKDLQHYMSRKTFLTFYIEKIQRKVLKFLFTTLNYIQYLHIFSKTISISMCILLFIEVFIGHKIMLFYYLCPLLFIPMIYKYLIFTLTNIYQELLEYLEKRLAYRCTTFPPEQGYYEDYMDFIFNTKNISAQEYIQLLGLQHLKLLAYTFKVQGPVKDSYVLSLFPELSPKEARKQFNYQGVITYSKSYIEYNVQIFCIFYKLNEITLKVHKPITLFILTLYLITWSYVIYKSFHTLAPDSFNWLKYLFPPEENAFIII